MKRNLEKGDERREKTVKLVSFAIQLKWKREKKGSEIFSFKLIKLKSSSAPSTFCFFSIKLENEKI